ncbi:MAG TPA: RluA family pseudouridine synthase [Gemmataceae bacterium]|nr:RluA family pseudouridine synthase [Gemmataceae bacterium]
MTKRIAVTRAEAGRTVASLLQAHLRLSAVEVRDLVRDRRVRVNGRLCPKSAWRVRTGWTLEVEPAVPPASPKQHWKKRASANASGIKPILYYVDAAIVVVDKPAGLTTMRHAHEAAEFGVRGRRFLPPTLADLLPGLIAHKTDSRPGRVRAVHRLDKETSGLVVFARTAEAERHLGRQFRAHTVERRYLALVRGCPQPGRIESYLVDDRGDGRRGSTSRPGEGQRAVTHVAVLEDLGDFALVECRLETGRTHQVRIHLGEQGTPLCGERIYDRPLHGQPLPDASGATRPCLHAASLAVEHPATGKRMAWSSPLSTDMVELLDRLRHHS